MPESKYPYKLAKLVIGKRTYIEFSVWSIDQNKLVRKRVGGIKGKSDRAKRNHAKPIIADINKLLASGYVVDARETEQSKLLAKIEKVRKYTLSEGLKACLESKAQFVRPRTLEAYKSFLNVFNAWGARSEIPKLMLDKITHLHLLEFFDWLKTNRAMNGKLLPPVGNRTYNNYLLTLRTFLNWCVERGMMEENQAKKIKPLPTERQKNFAFSDSEKERLEKYLRENAPELYLFTRFIYHTFARRAETLAIQIKDIDLQNRVLMVWAANSKTRTQRAIPINQKLFELLQSLNLERLPKDWHLFGKGGKPGISPWSRTRASEAHKKALQECGLDNGKLTLYSWKHTGVCNAVRLAGLSVVDVQKMCGHTSLEMTSKYLHSLGLNLNDRVINRGW